MNKKLRVGILGAGKMGHVYCDWFSRNPHCDVAAVYNRTRSRGEELAAQYEAAYYPSWEDLVHSPDIDVVGICTPSNLHLAQIEEAAKSGKHILCEKPMANNHNECRWMTDTCKAASVTLMVGFQMRFHPVIEAVDKLIAKIGPIYHIDFNFGMYRPKVDWRHTLEQGGGALKELGCHLFDLACKWCGDIAYISCENNSIEPNREVEDHSIALFRFVSGSTGYIYCGYEDRREPKICSTIMGRKGQINFTFSSYKTEDACVVLRDEAGTRKEEIPVAIPEYNDRVYPGHMDSFGREIGHFVSCVLNGKTPLVGGEEGYRSMELVCAAYESERLKTKVKLPLKHFDPAVLSGCFPSFPPARKEMSKE